MPESLKKPALAESLQGLRNRCEGLDFQDFDPETLYIAGNKLRDILDETLMLLQDEALQSANAAKPQAPKTVCKSAKPK